MIFYGVLCSGGLHCPISGALSSGQVLMRGSDHLAQALDALQALLIEQLFTDAAKRQFAAGDISRAELEPFTTAIAKLSDRYFSNQAPNAADLSAQTARAYAAYYTPINFAKVVHLLTELPPSLTTQPELSVLDFGCGPGTASLAMRAVLEPSLRITLVDRSSEMLSLADRLVSAFNLRGTAHLRTECSSNVPGETYDLVCAANVLSELSQETALERARALAGAVRENGALLLLEPALQDTTRRLMTIRDRLLAEHDGLVPLFPCTRADRCPMLATEPENWCHGVLRWREPRLVGLIDRYTGFNKHRIKYAAFLFQRGGALREGLRVITEPERTKRGSRTSVCGPGVYGECYLPKKSEIADAEQYDRVSRNVLENVKASNLPPSI